jgi:hypothetical protein
MTGTQRRTWLAAALLAWTCACGAPDPGDLIRRADGSRLESVAGWQLRDIHADEAIHFLYGPAGAANQDLGTVELRLSPRDDGRQALARTRSLDVDYIGPLADGRPPKEVAPLIDAFVATVTANDIGDLTLPPAPSRPPTLDAVPRGVARIIDRLSAATGIALVVAFLLALPWTVRALGRDLVRWDRRTLLILLAIGAAAIALRLLLPGRPVMHYMGYRLVQVATHLDPVPKYGPGALGLLHLLFRVTEPDHQAAILLHKVLGGLTVPVAAALLGALGAPRRTVLLGALLMAFTPLLVKDATTESLGVATLLWTLAGLALVARARSDGSLRTAALALLHLALSVLSRPEAIVLVPLAAAATYAWIPGPRPRSQGRRPPGRLAGWIALSAIATGLLALRIAQASLSVGDELSRGNTPDLATWAGMSAIATGTFLRNAAFWPSLFPTVVTVGALAAPFLVGRRERAPVLVLAGTGLAWIALAQLDLPYVSIPRVQAPGLAFLTLAGAWGLSVPAGKWPVRMKGVVRTVGAAIGITILAASMASTVPTLWARSNADDEEAFLQDAIAALPAESVTLVRRAYNDPPREPGHLDWPDYRFEPPFRNDRVLGIGAFLADPQFDLPVFFLGGVRCHLRACGESGPHPACLRMGDRFTLEPVLERRVPLRRLPIDRKPAHELADLDFGWCFSGPGPFRIGLYRVLPSGE